MNELFAIEPTAFEDHKDLKELLQRFGFYEGRFIAEYPGKWIKMVYEHINQFPDIERARAVAVLQRFKDDRIVPTGQPYQPSEPWLENARKIKRDGVVQDVIVDRRHIGVFPSPADADSEYFARWASRGDSVRSCPDGYGSAASYLIAMSEEIAIVDPWLRKLSDRYRAVIDRFAEIASRGRCRHFVAFTLDDGSSYDRNRLLGERFFEKTLGLGIRATLFVLREMGDPDGDEHARWLISVKGAMGFTKGFEEERPPQGRHVYFLDRPDHVRLFRQFLDAEQKFLPFNVVQRHKFEP